MDRYVEIAVGSPRNRGIVIPLSQLRKYIKNEPLFRSYYTFDEALVKHFDVRKTIRNYRGLYYLDRIIMDIDRGPDSDEECLKKARETIANLIEVYGVPPEWVQPWYSGRGYHIEMPDIFGLEPSTGLPAILKTTMQWYFPEADNVYDGGRIIRVGFTPNEKTLNTFYKTPLSLQEVMDGTVKEIQKVSRFQRFSFRLQPWPDDTELLEPVYPEHEEESEEPYKPKSPPSAVVTCVQHMYDEGDIKGSRHHKILRMVSSFRRHGVPKDAIKYSMLNWAQSMNSSEVERLVDDVFEKSYQYSCRDQLMDRYCDPRCVYYPAKARDEDVLVPILTPEDMESKYVHRLETIDEGEILDLNDIMQLGKSYQILPGELVIVIGDTGISKTAIVQNVCLETPMSSLWLELEMGPELMFRRFIQISEGKTKEEVDRHYRKGTDTWSKKMEHIRLISMAPRLEMIRPLVADVAPNMLIIDTLDCIVVQGYSDSMVKMDKIVGELRDIATSQNIIVIGISHITKADAKQGKLDAMSGKHSSSIAQKADKVIGVRGMQNNPVRQISSLKARDEQSFSHTCIIDPMTFRIRPYER